MAWFGLGLSALLGLLATLAAILQVDELKRWLEENWSLTFNSPIPAGWWLWLASIPAFLLLLYFLKLRRRPREVSSTLLWRKSIEDMHVNSLFQWLRRNLLLLLQLLILAGLGYALAGPTRHQEAQGRHLVFLLDNSASMSASDVKPSRLTEAKRRLREHIAALADSDHAMLVAFNDDASIIQSFTTRKADLLAAVDRVPASHRSSRIDQALALAEGQANPRRSTIEGSVEEAPPGQMGRALLPPEGLKIEAVIFSDGRFPDVPNFSAGRLRLRLELIGHANDANNPSAQPGPKNIAITRAAWHRDERRPDQLHVEVRVQSFLTDPLRDQVALLLEVMSSAGRVDRQSKPLSLLARTETVAAGDPLGPKRRVIVPGSSTPSPMETFTISDPGQGWIRLSLIDQQTGREWQDDLELDNRVWLAIAPVRRARVLQIGPDNEILDAFLRACVQRQLAVVTRLAAQGFEQNPVYQDACKAEFFDLIIFDRVAPSRPEAMPQANTFFIGAAPPWPDGKFEDLPVLTGQYVKEFRAAHPLMRGIETLQGMTIGQARALPPALITGRASALIETQTVPVLWVLGRERYSDLVMTFPLIDLRPGATGQTVAVWNTNWPSQPAGTLPLFLHNVVTQLGRFQESEEPSRPGRVKDFSPGRPVERAVIRQREPTLGRPIELMRLAGRDLSWNTPELVGLYEVEWGESEPFRFAVNLFDAEESLLDAQATAQLGEERLQAAAEPVRQHQELWPLLVAVALILVGLEWLLYLRRVAG